jgi:hypothetical protein
VVNLGHISENRLKVIMDSGSDKFFEKPTIQSLSPSGLWP